MAAMPVQEEDAQLVSQCLEFCQTLAGKPQTFSFSLTIGSHFSFSVDTRGKEVLAPKRKKKTPSTLRRDARRREELLKKKFAASTEIKCEQVSEKEAEVPRKAQTVLHHHPSPPASSERRQVTVVGREKVLPSFTQLDGEEDLSLLCAAEKEENIIAMEETFSMNFKMGFFIHLSIVCDTNHVHCDSIKTYHKGLGLGETRSLKTWRCQDWFNLVRFSN